MVFCTLSIRSLDTCTFIATNIDVLARRSSAHAVVHVTVSLLLLELLLLCNCYYCCLLLCTDAALLLVQTPSLVSQYCHLLITCRYTAVFVHQSIQTHTTYTMYLTCSLLHMCSLCTSIYLYKHQYIRCYDNRAALGAVGYDGLSPYCLDKINTSNAVTFCTMYIPGLLIVLLGSCAVLSITSTALQTRKR
jgi:hypothetical protein